MPNLLVFINLINCAIRLCLVHVLLLHLYLPDPLAVPFLVTAIAVTV